MDEFEELLKNQPLRAVPTHWREEILSTAHAVECNPQDAMPAAETSPAVFGWRQWLWPSPYAWGALAGAWIVIISLHFVARLDQRSFTQRPAPTAREIQAQLAERRRMEAELTQPETASAPPEPKPSPPNAYFDERNRRHSFLA